MRLSSTTALAVACLLVTAGCHSAATPDDAVRMDDSRKSPAIPALHAVVQWEQVTDGKNIARENYLLLMQHCKAAGWPTKELGPDEVQKLGTGVVEIWRDARGAYGRQTTWKLGVMDRSAAIADKGVCLAKLEKSTVEGDDDYTGLDWSDAAITDSAVEQDAQARMMGFERVGAAQVKGQPCTRWRSKSHEVCTWSAGKETGIEDGPVDSLCVTEAGPMSYLSPMPLESRQIAEGTGCNLQLQSMTVGKGLLPESPGAIGGTHTEE